MPSVVQAPVDRRPRVTITIHEQILTLVDRLADELMISRSAAIQMALREYFTQLRPEQKGRAA